MKQIAIFDEDNRLKKLSEMGDIRMFLAFHAVFLCSQIPFEPFSFFAIQLYVIFLHVLHSLWSDYII